MSNFYLLFIKIINYKIINTSTQNKNQKATMELKYVVYYKAILKMHFFTHFNSTSSQK